MRARELRREDGAAGEERRGIEEERGEREGERGEREEREGRGREGDGRVRKREGRGIDQEDRTRRRRKLTMTRSTPLSRYGCNTVYQVMCVRRE